MAEGFANYYGNHLLEASSAGSQPAGIIQPETIHIMQESGIDISKQSSKGLRDVKLEWMDWVIVLEVSLANSIRLPSPKDPTAQLVCCRSHRPSHERLPRRSRRNSSEGAGLHRKGSRGELTHHQN